MKRETGIVSVLAIMVFLSSCGGGGNSSVSSPYTGLTSAAVITDNNADDIALAAFQGGDLGANAVVPFAPARDIAVLQSAASPTTARPTALTLVQAVSKAAMIAVRPPAAAEGPSPRAPFTESDVIPDGLGGEARYTISGDNVTGVFTGTFEFVNFHGDGGGILVGNVSVSGTVTQDSIRILFNFQSVRIVDGAEDITAIGTVDLVSGASGDAAILNIVFVDNVSRKSVWLSDYTVAVTDLGGSTDVRTFGRIYLHDYGYVDIWTEAPFLYPALATQPTSGVITLTGSSNCRARLTVVDTTTYKVELDADGNGPYEWTVTHAW
jgi:hypothetical protein